MIVSILQRMGFGKAKPVHSRAGEAQPKKPAKGSKAGLAGPTDHAQEISARRHEVKAKSGKDSKAAATKTKASAVAKPAGKPVAKPSKPNKPAAKVVSKAPATPVAKGAVKKAATVAKVAPKPSAKPVAKAAAKPVAKVPAKKTAKPAEKVGAKSSVKPAAKTAAQPKTVVVKKPIPSDSKPAISKTRAVASPAPMSVSKTSAKPMQTTVSSKSKSPVAAPAVVEKAPAPAPVVAAVPAKAGRPSSRLAQLTVPSMAQTVASTAAKASYSQSAPTPIIVPALPSSIKKDPKLANNWKTTAVADLSDAELMAMPDSEYMNAVQLAAFRLKLTKLKLDILNSAGETTEHLREDTSVVPDPADRATIEEEHALELRTRDRERKLLKKIEQSIARIDAGDYGYCDETGEAIGVGRLLARPTATLSLEAQQRRELKQKMFGD
jgi:DnaK suppressor protein